jgi:hypothetical protein
MGALRLEAGARVGPQPFAIECEPVPVAGAELRDQGAVVAVRVAIQGPARGGVVGEHEIDPLAGWRPHAHVGAPSTLNIDAAREAALGGDRRHD